MGESKRTSTIEGEIRGRPGTAARSVVSVVMSEFLFHYYPVHPTTWAYLSSLLMIGLFFKFGRFWSVRNVDLMLLIALAPGLLLIHFGQEQADASALAASGSTEAIEDGEAERSTVAAATVSSLIEPRQSSVASDQTGAVVAPPPAGEEVDLSSRSLTEASDLTMSAEESDALRVEDGIQLDSDARIAAADGEGEEEAEEAPGRHLQRLGFLWLLAATALLLGRLLLDPTMVRRPLLEPNLSAGGLTFIGCSLFVFLMANVVSSPMTEDDLQGPRGAEQLLERVADDESAAQLKRHGPGNAVLHLLPSLVTMPQRWNAAAERSDDRDVRNVRYARTAKTMAILSHLAVVIGIVAIGYRHFRNIQGGIGVATLYLMLPYTSQMTGRVDHVVPAALLVWAVLLYRRPLPAGMFMGLAIGVVYYPLFLLPLWISFYWQRGLMRFLIGVFTMLLVMVSSLVFVSEDLQGFLANIQTMFGIWAPTTVGLGGIWGLGWEPLYRRPVLAAFVALSGAFALWPVQKNLGTLLSCSAAVMIATQFWHGYGGGLYVAWYLPLALLTFFRPNLEDRVALTVLGEGWFPRRRRHTSIKSVAA